MFGGLHEILCTPGHAWMIPKTKPYFMLFFLQFRNACAIEFTPPSSMTNILRIFFPGPVGHAGGNGGGQGPAQGGRRAPPVDAQPLQRCVIRGGVVFSVVLCVLLREQV